MSRAVTLLGTPAVKVVAILQMVCLWGFLWMQGSWHANLVHFSYCTIAVIAGALLWRQQRVGYITSLIVQVISIPVFTLQDSGVLWSFFTGARLTLGFTQTGDDVSLGIDAQAGGGGMFGLGLDIDATFIGINVVGLLTVAVLYWADQKLARQQAVSEAVSEFASYRKQSD